MNSVMQNKAQKSTQLPLRIFIYDAIAVIGIIFLTLQNAHAENQIRMGKSSYFSVSFMSVDYSKQDDEFSKIAVSVAQDFAGAGIDEVYAYGVTSDDGFRLAYGTVLSDKLILELAYMDLGAYEATIEMYSAVIGALGTITADSTAKSVEFKYLLDDIGSFSPHISVGLFKWDTTFSSKIIFDDGSSVTIPEESDDGQDSHFGIGGVFQISDKSRIGFDWRTFNTEIKFSAISASLEFVF